VYRICTKKPNLFSDCTIFRRMSWGTLNTDFLCTKQTKFDAEHKIYETLNEMNATNKNITLLFESERSALYEAPEFTAEQRAQYFTLTEKELPLVLSRKGLSAQIHFILQLGYFKAVKAFYRVQWIDTDPEDCQFILEQYFPHQLWESRVVTKYEFYAQCRIISQLFEYTLWKNAYRPFLSMQVEKILSRDITPEYIMMELLAYLVSMVIEKGPPLAIEKAPTWVKKITSFQLD